MSALAQLVLVEIRRDGLLKAGDRVGVAVSGGIDSVSLLRLLLELRGELGIVLSVVHFNHKLRGDESEEDERFVADLAREQGLEFLFNSDDVAEHASQKGTSVEAAARELRYGFFRHLLGSEGTFGDAPIQAQGSGRGAGSDVPPGYSPDAVNCIKLDKIVTGHTLDDQAETILLRLIRGTGIDGLSGIHPRILAEDDNGELCGEIVRPLLGTRRRELEQYLTEIGQVWREDSTNSDHSFTRNRLRILVLPTLEKEFNPAIAENLAELAEIARGEEEYWENEVAGWMGTTVHWVEPDWAQPKPALVRISGPRVGSSPESDTGLQTRIDDAPWLVANASVSRPWFVSEPVAVQRRVVKAVGEHAGIPLEFKHVEEILRFADEEDHSGRELSLPFGWKLVWRPEELLFVTPDLRRAKPPGDYEYEINVPGQVALPELALVIEARCVPAYQVAEYNPDELLNLDPLPGQLRVRNWRAGDRFWPAHSKSPKKIKELLQELRVAQPERSQWPVVVSGDEIMWVRGFAVHAKYMAKPGCGGVLLRDRPLLETEKLD